MTGPELNPIMAPWRTIDEGVRRGTRLRSTSTCWPTTYRWTATIVDGDPPTMTSRWFRTDGDRGESYHSFTRSS